MAHGQPAEPPTGRAWQAVTAPQPGWLLSVCSRRAAVLTAFNGFGWLYASESRRQRIVRRVLCVVVRSLLFDVIQNFVHVQSVSDELTVEYCFLMQLRFVY